MTVATPHILENVRIFTGGADLTAASNKVEIAAEVEEKDVTTFNDVDGAGHIWKAVKGGLATATIDVSGFWEASDISKVDDDAWAALGGAGAWTIMPTTSTVGSLAWLTSMLRSKYGLLGSVGDVAPFVTGGTSTWALSRGISLQPPGTARTATGNGTGNVYVATSASQYLYANLHVLSVSGTATPTITVAIESDATGAFSGSQTTRITFTAATVRGGQSKQLIGPITDTFYRAKWTISGTNPSFLFAVAVGVF